MIRRHGRTLRFLLMIGDAVVAMLVLTAISEIRVAFDPAWPGIWRVVPAPAVFLTLYSLLWVGLLGSQGMYQSRANWTMEREASGVIRAAVLLGLITLASLFLLQLDAVSRPVLLAVVPVQAAVTIVARAAIRSFLRALRRRGRNLRQVLIVGTGPAALDYAAHIEERWDLGFVIIGLVGDQTPETTVPMARPRAPSTSSRRSSTATWSTRWPCACRRPTGRASRPSPACA